MKVTGNLPEYYLSSFYQELCLLKSRVVFEKSKSLRKVISIVTFFELGESDSAILSNNQVLYFVFMENTHFLQLFL